MPRLFTGPRELTFFSDVTKELIKDLAGQCIFYYSINEFKTRVHPLYNEAVEKFFNTPVSLDALVSAEYTKETRIDRRGVDKQYMIDVFAQYRDLADKNVKPCIGDFFSFSDLFYEIADVIVQSNIHGLPEHRRSYKISGVKVRRDQFEAKLIGPTDITHPEPGSVMQDFVQQRGLDPSDKRYLQDQGKVEYLRDTSPSDVDSLYNES